MEEYKVHPKHFDYYIKRCEYWLKKLRLTYRVDYKWLVDKNKRGATGWSYNSKIAIIYLTPDWDIKPTNKELNKVAFHEVLHLLLGELSGRLLDTYSENEVDRMSHDVIRSLEYLLED